MAVAAVAGSALAILVGSRSGRRRMALIADASSYGVLLVVLFALSLGPISRDVVGFLLVTAVALRFVPGVRDAVTTEISWHILFALAFVPYVCLTFWHQAASLPLGDQ